MTNLKDVPDFPIWVEQYIRDNRIRTDYRFTDIPRERLSMFEGIQRKRIVLEGSPSAQEQRA